MKTILAASIMHLIFSSYSFANGGLSPERQEAKSRGSTSMDEVYVDELKSRKAGLQKEEKEKIRIRETPRSRGQLDSKEDEQER